MKREEDVLEKEILPASVSGCTRYGPVSSRGGLPLLLVHEEALKSQIVSSLRGSSLFSLPLSHLTTSTSSISFRNADGNIEY